MREACTPRREVADSPFDYAPLKTRGTRTTHKCLILAQFEPVPIAWLRDLIALVCGFSLLFRQPELIVIVPSFRSRNGASYSAHAFALSCVWYCFRLKLAFARAEDESAVTRSLPKRGGDLYTAGARRLAEFAITHKLPSMYGPSEHARAWRLMSFGPDRADLWRRGAIYAAPSMWTKLRDDGSSV
jgi:hypothetical protein